MTKSYTLTEGQCELRLIRFLKDVHHIPFGKVIKKNIVTTPKQKLLSIHRLTTQSKTYGRCILSLM
ncbi:hypothetical protein A4S06_11335 [Erysipelotrichaceae bacterium MTC7]|nr:hypothetical protein A4S06_11335 [Erysipelotrichaceae bacterium MTC7]